MLFFCYYPRTTWFILGDALRKKLVHIVFIPGHVSAAGYDLIVVQKPATTEVAGVARQFPTHTDVAFASF